MRRFSPTRGGAVLVLVCTAAFLAGCDVSPLASNVASFSLGAWFTSQITTTTVEYRCLRDGVEVDCSTLPGFTN